MYTEDNKTCRLINIEVDNPSTIFWLYQYKTIYLTCQFISKSIAVLNKYFPSRQFL